MSARSRNAPRHDSVPRRWDQRISLVFFGFMTAFLLAAFVAVPFNLPTNPDKWWVHSTAITIIETGTMCALMCLPIMAFYLLDAKFRALAGRFRSGRIGRLAFAVMLPASATFLAYGVALLQGPALWNKFFFVILLGAMVASMVLLVAAYVVWYFDNRRLSIE